eukprot:gene9629-1833_t
MKRKNELNEEKRKRNKRNEYLEKVPNFIELGEKYPNFKNFLNEKNKIDFTDEKAMKELTKVLLKEDFNIEWDMPLNHLIPPVMNRVNYIYWLDDLLKIKKFNESIKGIDIGVGSSCIYPLLGNSIYGWKFLGTEIDKESVKFSNENIKRNNLEKEIKIIQVDDETLILNNVIPNDEKFDFCMCNPPFFSDEIESIRNNPKTICTGNKNELMTEGGELNFISKIIEDSLVLKNQICWFTSMIGKKDTLKKLKIILVDLHIKYYITEFINGNITRWAIAWKFSETESSQNQHIKFSKKMKLTFSDVKYVDLIKKVKLIISEHCNNVKFNDINFTSKLKGTECSISIQIFQISQNQFYLSLETKEINTEFKELFKSLAKASE